MEIIKKRELFKYLEERLENDYYVGLHGISDIPDIQNQYANMSKLEKAESIMKIGLMNERHKSIKSTCKIYGRLSDTYEKYKDQILGMNGYTCYRTKKEHVIVIVAVPTTFEHSDGRKILGGWMNVNVLYSDDDSPVECITDKLFREEIPKEMILGYYYFENENPDAHFVGNDAFYENLAQEQKDKFIEKLFDRNDLAIDLNNTHYMEELMKRVRNQPNGYDVNLRENMIEQANELQQEKEHNCVDKKDGYTFEELEMIPLEKVDIDRIIPTYEMLTSSKYQIKDIILNKCFADDGNLANDVGYYRVNSIHKNEHVDVEEFEKWVKQYNNNPDNLYQVQYQRYYKELGEAFRKHIKTLKEKKMNSQSIYLNDKIHEYIQLGMEIGLFKKDELKDIYSQLQNVEIVEDNTLSGDAQAIIADGKNIIKINRKRCEGQAPYFLDEVLFHELSHFTNGIHQDLYGDKQHKIMTFKNKYADFSKDNPLVKYPEWGAILLDEAISQRVAQTMVEKKYGKGIYSKKGFYSKLIGKEFALVSEFADYPEYETLANQFAKTIVGKEGLMGLAKLSMKPEGIDTIFSKYSESKDGAKKLYEILGYMGNVAIADYASKGHFVLPNSEINREKSNVLKSMQRARWLMKDEIELSGQSGHNYGD